MNNFLMVSLLLSQYNYEYNEEYVNLSEEEKDYLSFIDECLKDINEIFSNACTKAMLFILDALNRMDTSEELTKEEAKKQKEELLKDLNQEDQKRLELFMYACIQTIGIYSEERIEERNKEKEKSS